MIDQLRGRRLEIYPSHVIVDCNGVGYSVQISLTTFNQIEDKEEIKIYTQFVVREDAQLLYGFAERAERTLFQKLVSVNGVGPASAMMMLSSLNPTEIFTAIESADVKTLQGVKGIGAKTAQRIIIDLKDKLPKMEDLDIISTTSKNKNKLEALSALDVLGVASKAANTIIDNLLKTNPEASVEELVREALKRN